MQHTSNISRNLLTPKFMRNEKVAKATKTQEAARKQKPRRQKQEKVSEE